MPDFEFISPDSENILPSLTEQQYQAAADVDYDHDLSDPVGNAVNRTVFGLGDFETATEVERFLRDVVPRAVGNARGLLDPQRSWLRKWSPVRRAVREPYEFRFFPITGANQEQLPAEGLLLPLPPEKFDVERGSEPRTFISINQLEYTLPGPNQLASLTLEGMFPGVDPNKWGKRGADGRVVHRPSYLPGYVTRGNYMTPKELASTFTNLMVKAQPVNLSIGPPNGSSALVVHGGGIVGRFGMMAVTVTNFTYGEAFGHPGSYVFSMTLKQWRKIYPKAAPAEPKPPTPTTPNPTNPRPTRPAPTRPSPPLKKTSLASAPDVRTYVIRSGDTLWDIAARFLGSGSRWPEVYSLNRSVLEAECRRRKVSCYPKGWNIWPGTRLRLPPKQSGR